MYSWLIYKKLNFEDGGKLSGLQDSLTGNMSFSSFLPFFLSFLSIFSFFFPSFPSLRFKKSLR